MQDIHFNPFILSSTPHRPFKKLAGVVMLRTVVIKLNTPVENYKKKKGNTTKVVPRLRLTTGVLLFLEASKS